MWASWRYSPEEHTSFAERDWNRVRQCLRKLTARYLAISASVFLLGIVVTLALGGRGSAGSFLLCLSALILMVAGSSAVWQFSLAREFFLKRIAGPHEIEITPTQITEAQQEIPIVSRRLSLEKVSIAHSDANVLRFKIKQIGRRYVSSPISFILSTPESEM